MLSWGNALFFLSSFVLFSFFPSSLYTIFRSISRNFLLQVPRSLQKEVTVREGLIHEHSFLSLYTCSKDAISENCSWIALIDHKWIRWVIINHEDWCWGEYFVFIYTLGGYILAVDYKPRRGNLESRVILQLILSTHLRKRWSTLCCSVILFSVRFKRRRKDLIKVL